MYVLIKTNYRAEADGKLYLFRNIYEVTEEVGKEIIQAKCGIEHEGDDAVVIDEKGKPAKKKKAAKKKAAKKPKAS